MWLVGKAYSSGTTRLEVPVPASNHIPAARRRRSGPYDEIGPAARHYLSMWISNCRVFRGGRERPGTRGVSGDDAIMRRPSVAICG